MKNATTRFERAKVGEAKNIHR